ncbi:jg19642 [Pararge aegeria aegeria]|uniref:Jg19642 protein n=1 Tax=Pararge aegeria aegeria TaxID=348720 RepID=A0A8S4S8J3_9NEOP|nr:jg19642 [Pararge aegeria aegeria]
MPFRPEHRMATILLDDRNKLGGNTTPDKLYSKRLSTTVMFTGEGLPLTIRLMDRKLPIWVARCSGYHDPGTVKYALTL